MSLKLLILKTNETMALKPKREELTIGQLLFLFLMLIFIAVSAIRGGYLYLRDFLIFIYDIF